jgi:peptide/nickel transport system substrate-binding protein
MRDTLLRQLAVTSVALGCLFAATRVETARRPRYGGTLRVEIGATVNSVDPMVAAADSEEATAKEQIDALIYDRRNSDGTFTGAGPFRIAEWEPGKHLTLAANDDYSGGRPFVDSIEIQMGRNVHDRLLDIELDRADFAEIPPEQARRASDTGVRISTSQPDELVALVFVAGRSSAEDAKVREAIAHSIDRGAIVNFIAQKEGEPAGGLLPQWSGGTAFLFSAAADVTHSKELWAQIAPSPRVVLGYDSGDSFDQALAERIAVNAREAGISLAVKALSASKMSATSATAPGNPDVDVRLMHWRMPSPLSGIALTRLLGAVASVSGVDPAPLPDAASPQQIYDRERSVVDSFRIVPLIWLPQVYGLSARVRDWKPPAPGETWPLADVWLDVPGSSTGVQ